MTQRDYVKKKAKPQNKSRIIPNFMMVIAVILVILFIAILYFISTNKANKPVTQQPDVTEKPQTTLPDKPEERWTYLKELENPEGNPSPSSNAQTKPSDQERQQILNSFMDDKTQPSANEQPTVHWLLQCGAFKEDANAEALKAKLAMLGVTSFIKSEKFHRVLVGPYPSKTAADNAITKLKNEGISSCITIQK